MQANRIFHLGRDPHPTPRAVLLEVNFINSPEINLRISCQCAEFFYALLVIVRVPRAGLGRPGQSVGGAFGGETPTAGISAGNCERKAPLSVATSPIAAVWDHPKDWPGVLRPAENRAGFGSLAPIACLLVGTDVRSVHLPATRQSRDPQSDAPSIRPSEVRRPKGERPLGNSLLPLPTTPREVGDRSAIHLNDGSRLEWPRSLFRHQRWSELSCFDHKLTPDNAQLLLSLCLASGGEAVRRASRGPRAIVNRAGAEPAAL